MVKFRAAPDVYTKIQDFIDEFTSEDNEEYETNWGLDFEYKNKTYHFARYPAENEEMREGYEKILGYSLKDYKYEIILNEPSQSPFSFDDITILGFYKTCEDFVNSFSLDGVLFKDLLLQNLIKITSKD